MHHFWLYYPKTSSTVEVLIGLVYECYSSNEHIERRNDSGSSDQSQKGLAEKVKKFNEETKKRNCIKSAYLIQSVLQTSVCLAFVLLNTCIQIISRYTTVTCTIDIHISVEYDYFMCSSNLLPIFWTAFDTFWFLECATFLYFFIVLTDIIYKGYSKKCEEGDMGFLLALLREHSPLYESCFVSYTPGKPATPKENSTDEAAASNKNSTASN